VHTKSKTEQAFRGLASTATSPGRQEIRLLRSIFPVTVPVYAGVMVVINDGSDDSLLSAWCAGGSEDAFTALSLLVVLVLFEFVDEAKVRMRRVVRTKGRT
jgi:hypothetical protein